MTLSYLSELEYDQIALAFSDIAIPVSSEVILYTDPDMAKLIIP